MGNPVARVETVNVQVGPNSEDYKPAYRHVVTFCPGCGSRHAFTIEVYDGYTHRQDRQPMPTWDWDGNLERPTFSPSLLAYSTVHLCPPDYTHIEECPGECEHRGHGFAWKFPDGRLQEFKVHEQMPEEAVRVRTHYLPHAVEPAWGNCHSFLRSGVWEFLGDSDHHLAGQRVPMVPLPDWIMRED